MMWQWDKNSWIPIQAIPCEDRGFLYGDGVFRTALLREGEIECLEAHLTRLEKEAFLVGITLPPNFLEKATEPLKELTGIFRCKWIVTRGTCQQRALPRSLGAVYLSAKPYTPFESAVKVCLRPRFSPAMKVKSLSYVSRLELTQQARALGAQEALEVDEQGRLVECSFANLLWKEQGKWKTPNPQTHALYFGVTIEQMVQKGEVTFSEIKSTHRQFKFYGCNALRGIYPLELLYI